jgi:hypothetical protein
MSTRKQIIQWCQRSYESIHVSHLFKVRQASRHLSQIVHGAKKHERLQAYEMAQRALESAAFDCLHHAGEGRKVIPKRLCYEAYKYLIWKALEKRQWMTFIQQFLYTYLLGRQKTLKRSCLLFLVLCFSIGMVFSVGFAAMLPEAWWNGQPMKWADYLILSFMCVGPMDFGELKLFGTGAIIVGMLEYFLGYAALGYAVTVLWEYNTTWVPDPGVKSLTELIEDLRKEGSKR